MRKEEQQGQQTKRRTKSIRRTERREEDDAGGGHVSRRKHVRARVYFLFRTTNSLCASARRSRLTGAGTTPENPVVVLVANSPGICFEVIAESTQGAQVPFGKLKLKFQARIPFPYICREAKACSIYCA